MAERGEPRDATQAWCSLRLRFDEAELGLLRSAEQLYGSQLSQGARRDTLRDALLLAKLGKKLAAASAGAMLVLSELEVRLVVTALRASLAEVQQVSALSPGGDASERTVRLRQAFPELRERMWRAFAVCRQLETLAGQIEQAVSRS